MRQLPVIQPEAAAVEHAAGEATAAPARRFRVEGMDCGACARTVERAVGGLEGIDTARVSFGAGLLETWGEAPAERVLAAVAAAGYEAQPYGRRSGERRAAFWRGPRALSTLAALILLALAVVLDLAGADGRTSAAAYAVPMIVGGWPIARAALVGLRNRTLDMNVLMTLAALGAVAIGANAEAAWVLVLFALGTTLETLALHRTRRSVERLGELQPDRARVRDADGTEHRVAVEEVAVGSTIVVHPGERMPLDGVVLDGASAVDQSPITGESMPVDRVPGDPVFAGSLNQQGALAVRTTRDAASSTVNRIVELVEQAQASRAPSERFVDRFARIYTPLVVGAAVAVAVVPPLFGGDVDTWLYRALALLIVACPCSLVISIPVAVVSAIGGAARDGVLIKGGEALERLARVRVVCFDKTGTLTRGTPELHEVVVVDPALGEEEALGLMATLERRSEHPLAAALVRAAAARGIAVVEPARFLALPGRGVEALVDGRPVWAGGPRLVQERSPAVPAALGDLEARGRTVVALGSGDRVLALFALADTVRPEAAAALQALAPSQRLVMLTGDNEAVARAVAAETGLEWRAGLLPEDKLRVVAELERESGPVAMVGDGVNDAPALAAAHVGIALGAAGSGVALETADVALMRDDLTLVPAALRRARASLALMRQNVIASLGVKGGFVLLAPLGLVPLWLAVAADMGMSLLVTLNAMRLLRPDAGG